MLADDSWQSARTHAPHVATRPAVAFRSPAFAWLRATGVTAIAAFLVFVVFPRLDVEITRHFYVGDNQFLGYGIAPVGLLRLAFNFLFYAVCSIGLVGLAVTATRAQSWLGLDCRKWLFLALCLIMGPLVVTNIGLKDHWGRARPRDVIEFGGTKAYTAAFPPAKQCDYNCSFVSGEASSIYIVFFAGAFLFPAFARSAVAGGIVMGSLAGLIRISQGGHFTSDVVFAGIAMAATAAGIWLLFDFLSAPNGVAGNATDAAADLGSA